MIASAEFQAEHKQQPRDFTRQRILTFPRLVIGLINLFNRTIAVELSKLLGLFGQSSCSKQAFSEQRQKLKPEAFAALNKALIQAFYADQLWGKFYGFRLLAADGSTLQLPESLAVIAHFGTVDNQHGQQAMGQGSMLYDIENRLTLSAQLESYRSSERALLAEQLGQLEDTVPTLLVLDQGYRSLTLMHQINSKGWHFIIRVPGQAFLNEVKQASAAGQRDALLSIDLQQGWPAHDPGLKALAHQRDNQLMSVRLIVVDLPDGRPRVPVEQFIGSTGLSPFFLLSSLWQTLGHRNPVWL